MKLTSGASVVIAIMLFGCSTPTKKRDLTESSDSFQKDGKEYSWTVFEEVYFNYDPRLKIRTTLGINWKDKETIEYHLLSESKKCKKELEGVATVAEYKANIKEPDYITDVKLTKLDKTNTYMIGFSDKMVDEATTMVIRIAPTQSDPCFNDKFIRMYLE